MVEGLLAISRLRRSKLRSGLAVAVVAVCVLNVGSLAKIVLPITPAERLQATGLDTQNPDFASTVGWPSIANHVTALYDDLPAAGVGSWCVSVTLMRPADPGTPSCFDGVHGGRTVL
jgi:hypothetical protein